MRKGPSLFNVVSVALGLAVLYLPITILVIYSFNASRLVTVWGGWSIRWYVALLGLSVVPAAVGVGIVRNQLFDIRLAARSSAAYGAVTLGITGLFALAISFADALFAGFNVDARTPGFSIVFLFFAWTTLAEQV